MVESNLLLNACIKFKNEVIVKKYLYERNFHDRENMTQNEYLTRDFTIKVNLIYIEK